MSSTPLPGATRNQTHPPVFLFDGVCVLCSRSVAFVLKHERAPLIRFVAIQSAEGRALAETHGIDPDDPESFLFIENGIALPKSAGIAALVGHLRAPWNWLSAFHVLPLPVRDWMYDRIARNRYRLFGKRETCLIPTPQTRQRFAVPD
jgi:predicted DCC family thiol-disulfide oxidoreductase YuxK